MNLGGIHLDEIAAIARGNFLAGQLVVAVHDGIRLGDVEVLVTVTAQVFDLVGHAGAVHLAIRGFDETELVDPGKRAQGADQADVRAFRRLDRADAPVV